MPDTRIHFDERMNVPKKLEEHCWICHEALPPDTHNAVFDASIGARYHASPSSCADSVRMYSRDYSKSSRGKWIPVRITRRRSYGDLCRRCTQAY